MVNEIYVATFENDIKSRMLDVDTKIDDKCWDKKS